MSDNGRGPNDSDEQVPPSARVSDPSKPTPSGERNGEDEPDHSGLTAQRYYLTRLAPSLARYLGIWIAIGLAIGIAGYLVPELRLIRSGAALTLVGQVLAPTATAILVLILASAFVVAQVSIGLYGSRAGLILLSDLMLLGLVFRALLVVLAGLACLVFIPDGGLGGPVNAAFATILLAAMTLIVRSPIALSTVFNAYTAPTAYATNTREKVRFEVMARADSVAGFKVPALGEMLRSALRRGDGLAVAAAVDAIETLATWWTEHVERLPSARHLRLPSGGEVQGGWLVRDLGDSLIRAVDEGLRGSAPHAEVDRLVDALEHLCGQSLLRGLNQEATVLVEQLAEVGTTTQQVVAPQTVNLLVRPAGALTSLEALAEDIGRPDFAAHALALWTLVVSWMLTQYGHENPMLLTNPQNFGPSPPWEAAQKRIQSRDFRETWVNQIHDPQALADTLHIARKLHAGEPLDLEEPNEAEAPNRLTVLRFRLARFLLGGPFRGGPEAGIPKEEVPKVLGVPPPLVVRPG